jgi:hypothetical protein
MTKKELIIWWIFFVIFTPLAIDYSEGFWTGLGWINDTAN